MKRKLEIQIIRDNKQADLLDELLKIDIPLERHVALKERADHLRKTLVRMKKHEEKMEMLRLKEIEKQKKKFEEELRRKIQRRREEIARRRGMF